MATTRKKRAPKKVPVGKTGKATDTIRAFAMVKTGAGMWRVREYAIPASLEPIHESTDRGKGECISAVEVVLAGARKRLPS